MSKLPIAHCEDAMLCKIFVLHPYPAAMFIDKRLDDQLVATSGWTSWSKL